MTDYILTTLFPFLVGLFVSGIGVYYTMKYRPRGRLEFVIRRYLPLVDEITRALPALELKYNGEPVSNRLILVEGFLRNAGYLDISHEDIKRQINFMVPPNYNIIDASGSDYISDIQYTSKSIPIEVDLIKSGEMVPFKFLVEACDEDNNEDDQSLIEGISRAARRFVTLSNVVGGVKNTNIALKQSGEYAEGDFSRSRLYRLMSMLFVATIMTMAVSVSVIGRLTFSEFKMENKEHQIQRVKITPFEHGKIIVLETDDNKLFNNLLDILDLTQDMNNIRNYSAEVGYIPIDFINDEWLASKFGIKIAKYEADYTLINTARALIFLEAATIIAFFWVLFVKYEAHRFYIRRVREWAALRQARKLK